MQLTTLVLATLSSLASAQTTHVVAVAQNGSLTYLPDKLSPSAGDFVQFQFHAGNHTVTQSTFPQPCQPVGMNSNVTGFHSGFMPVAASASQGMLPTYTIRINDTRPLWIYCATGPHCQRGMVMVLNEPNDGVRTLAAYKAAAAQATTVVPGAASGGTAGSGSGGSGTGGGSGGSVTGGAPRPTQSLNSGVGDLAAPGTLALVAAAAAALFL